MNVEGDLMYKGIRLLRSVKSDRSGWMARGTRAVIVDVLAPGKAWLAEITVPSGSAEGQDIFDLMEVEPEDFEIFDEPPDVIRKEKQFLEAWEKGISG